MSDVVTNLTLNGIHRAMTDLGFETSLSVVEGTEIPCIWSSTKGNDFFVYFIENQPLCFQSTIERPSAGFTDVANYWNSARRFAKAIPFLDGYILRFEAEISHGVTRNNLRALIRAFSASVEEFSIFAASPNNPLP